MPQNIQKCAKKIEKKSMKKRVNKKVWAQFWALIERGKKMGYNAKNVEKSRNRQ